MFTLQFCCKWFQINQNYAVLVRVMFYIQGYSVLYKTDNCLSFLQQENKQLWHGSDTVQVVSVKRGKDAQFKVPGAFGFCSISGWTGSQGIMPCFLSSGFAELQCQLFASFFSFEKMFLGDGREEY